jgi:hypothetical protein
MCVCVCVRATSLLLFGLLQRIELFFCVCPLHNSSVGGHNTASFPVCACVCVYGAELVLMRAVEGGETDIMFFSLLFQAVFLCVQT